MATTEKYPVIIAYNVLRSFFNEYGRGLHRTVGEGLGVNGNPVGVIPIVNGNRSQIITRAEVIKE